jgi:hypothetical protein
MGWVNMFRRNRDPFAKLTGEADMEAVRVQPATQAWYSIPISGLPDLVAAYVKIIESGETATSGCKCQWIIHPDDVDKPEGKRRIRQGEATLDCPVHTKEGFLLGFYAWMLELGACRACAGKGCAECIGN